MLELALVHFMRNLPKVNNFFDFYEEWWVRLLTRLRKGEAVGGKSTRSVTRSESFIPGSLQSSVIRTALVSPHLFMTESAKIPSVGSSIGCDDLLNSGFALQSGHR